MQQDCLNELAELALGARLKRLCERVLANASDVYQEFSMNINPKWLPLMTL
jgi:hypothetical protein